MAEVTRGNLDAPAEVITFPKITAQLVDLGDLTVGLFVAEPGWRWSEHNRPKVGGDWCQARHIGVIISGQLGIDFSDGTSTVFGPHDVFDIPPGHDGHTVGDEPMRPDRVVGDPRLGRLSHGRAQPRAAHPALHGSRRVDADRRACRGRPVARAPVGALHRRPRRARALSGARGDDDGGRHRRDVRRACAGIALCGGHSHARRTRTTSTCAPASTSARSSSSATTCVGSPCTRRRGSWPRPARTRSSSPSSRGRLPISTDLAFEDRGARELKGLDGEWKLAAFVG